MNLTRCLYCGSSNLRADRALSGRLVCTACGNPYGSRTRSKVLFSKKGRYKRFNFLLFLLVIIVIFCVVIFST